MTTPGTISSAADFKNANPTGIPFKLPSGLTCAVKRPGVTELIAEGLFPDSLMGVVSGFVNKAQGKKPQDRKPTAAQQKKIDEKAQNDAMAKVTEDPEQLREMLLTVDKAAVYCIVEPVVTYNRYAPETHPDLPDHMYGKIIAPAERDDDKLYVDQIDEDDRMAVFNFAVGGDDDEQAEAKAAVTFPDSGATVGDVQDG
jgi:hypothetical protein